MATGVIGKFGGLLTRKAITLITVGTAAVAGAAAGGIWYVNRDPELRVVQRSASVEVAARGENVAIVACESHETVFNGGFAVGEGAIVTRSHFLGAAWLVSAYNPTDEPAKLTGYALCVNAHLDFQPNLTFTKGSHAFLNHNEISMSGRASGAFAALADPVANPYCANGYTAVGMEFRAERSVAGRPVAPVPLDRLISGAQFHSGQTDLWWAGLNPGTNVNHDHVPPTLTSADTDMTRAMDPQPAQATYAPPR